MMFSEMLVKIWNEGILPLGIWETVYMTFLSTIIAYGFGIPLGKPLVGQTALP